MTSERQWLQDELIIVDPVIDCAQAVRGLAALVFRGFLEDTGLSLLCQLCGSFWIPMFRHGELG